MEESSLPTIDEIADKVSFLQNYVGSVTMRREMREGIDCLHFFLREGSVEADFLILEKDYLIAIAKEKDA